MEKAYVKQVWVRSCWFTGLQRGSLCLQDMATGTGWETRAYCSPSYCFVISFVLLFTTVTSPQKQVR